MTLNLELLETVLTKARENIELAQAAIHDVAESSDHVCQLAESRLGNTDSDLRTLIDEIRYQQQFAEPTDETADTSTGTTGDGSAGANADPFSPEAMDALFMEARKLAGAMFCDGVKADPIAMMVDAVSSDVSDPAVRRKLALKSMANDALIYLESLERD